MNKELYKEKEKRKKVLLNILTIFGILIIVLLIFFSNDNLRSRMGSIIGCRYTCSKGYNLDETTNTCYKEIEKDKTYQDASLLGDIDKNGKINNSDFNLLRSNISIEEYNYLYDINQDKIINEDDLTELASIISLAKASKEDPTSKYICPSQIKEEKNSTNHTKKYIIVDYELENKRCIVKKKIKIEKSGKYSCR